MRMNRSLQRCAAFGLLLALLWAAIHPAVINAFPRQAQQALFCTTNGMVWLDAHDLGYEPIEMQFAQPGNGSPDGPSLGRDAFIASTPWCQHAVVFERTDPAHQRALGIYAPWGEYVVQWAVAPHVLQAQPLLYQRPLNRAPPAVA